MRPFVLFFVVLLLSWSPLGAQEKDLPGTEGSPDGGSEGAGPSAVRMEGPGAQAPAERVRELVREAMRTPDRREVWAGLALSLTEMGEAKGGEGAGRDRLDDAVRVADSLAFAPGLSPGRDHVEDEMGHHWNVGIALSALAARPWAVPGFLALVLLGIVAFRVGRKGGEAAHGREIPHPPATLEGRPGDSRPPEGTPWNFALALWESGLPPSEVARRTGLAQDTLAVLTALQGGGARRGPGADGAGGRL